LEISTIVLKTISKNSKKLKIKLYDAEVINSNNSVKKKSFKKFKKIK
jgi:hypothetical protein